MALIILRSRFNEAARRAIGQPGAGQTCRDFQDLCTELGFETIDGGRSTTGEAVNILRGPADKIVLLQRVMDQTGGYDEISAEIIDPWQTVAATAAEASRLGRRSHPDRTKSTACCWRTEGKREWRRKLRSKLRK